MAGWQLILFISIVTFVLISGGLYIERRLVSASKLGPAGKRAARVVLFAIVALQILGPMIYRRSPQPYSIDSPLGWLALFVYLSLGLLAYLFFCFFMGDLALLARRPFASKPVSDERRHWLRRGLAGTAALATGGAYAQARSGPKVEQVEIAIPGLGPELDGFVIAQVSDLHVGPTIGREYVEGIVATVNGFKADMVALTGDFVDGQVSQLGHVTSLLKGLEAKEGVYYITGNHEFFSGAVEWVREFRSYGFHVLENQHRVITRGTSRLVIAGVHDRSAGRFGEAMSMKPRAAVEGAPAGVPRVMLAHQPQSADEVAEAGADLMLSGHTHGGQFFPWSLLVHLAIKYARGLYRHQGPNGPMWVYVNRGAAYWGPPMRLAVPSEITRITLRKA